jgi:peroxiredoxin
MAKIESSMIPLGTQAPEFSLYDTVSDKVVTLVSNEKFMATVILFICNHCPYVKHINPELARLSAEYTQKGVRFIAISSNDVEAYPDDSPENMKRTAKEHHYHFPYLFDETQEVARAYQATCTPDFFVYNNELNLVYRGQLDDSRPGNMKPLDGSSIRTALDCILNDTTVPAQQKPSIGCNIKWKHPLG